MAHSESPGALLPLLPIRNLSSSFPYLFSCLHFYAQPFPPSKTSRHPPGQVCFMKTRQSKLTAPWGICQARGASHTHYPVLCALPPGSLTASSHQRARGTGSSKVQVGSLPKATWLGSTRARARARAVLPQSLCAGPRGLCWGRASPWRHSTPGYVTHPFVPLFIHRHLCFLLDLTFLSVVVLTFLF